MCSSDLNPSQMLLGPKVTLLNEYSASDGDLFPYRFREHGLGKLIGKRSWGGTARVGSAERPAIDAYTAWWNDFGVLWIQVESIQAICNIPMLAAPGVDCISWGPSDLAIDRSLNPRHPLTVSDDACVEYAVRALEGTGARLAYRSYDWNLRSKYVDMGATVLLERPKS